MNSRWKKRDAYGQVIHPGDICVRSINDKVELVIYKGESWGGKESKGEFGRFITPSGNRSLKYTGVVFAFDPMGERRNKSEQVTKLVREFYEGK